MSQCPCKSGKTYEACCKVYHEGMLPEKAEALMLSRYSAYAKGLKDYLMDTTHPSNPKFTPDREKWAANIMQFSKKTTFEDLKILDVQDGETTSYVTFKAILKQAGKDATFTEESRFFKVNGKWLYVDGKIT